MSTPSPQTKLPPLPLASITEGSRTLFSAAQLRDYGRACHELGHVRGYEAGYSVKQIDAPSKTPGEVPDFFESIFGVKK